jgi:hypothetical protein
MPFLTLASFTSFRVLVLSYSTVMTLVIYLDVIAFRSLQKMTIKLIEIEVVVERVPGSGDYL